MANVVSVFLLPRGLLSLEITRYLRVPSKFRAHTCVIFGTNIIHFFRPKTLYSVYAYCIPLTRYNIKKLIYIVYEGIEYRRYIHTF